MDNPFDFNMPARNELFVGRRGDVSHMANSLSSASRTSYGVIGGKRCGKSSLLEALAYELRRRLQEVVPGQRHVISVFVPLKTMSRLGSADDVLGVVLHEVRRAVCGTRHRGPVVECGFPRYVESVPTPVQFLELRDILEGMLDEALSRGIELRIVLLIDEMDAVIGYNWTATLFGNLRSLIYDPSPVRDSVRIVLAGSGRYVEVDERGSQLINALVRYDLYALDEPAIFDLISKVPEIEPAISEHLVELVGGSPFMAQFFLHHLVSAGPGMATPTLLTSIRDRFCFERSQDLAGWWVAIGNHGQTVYRLLAEHTDWIPSSEIRKAVERSDHALEKLSYHGLIRHRNDHNEYRIAGTLFRDWSTINAGTTALTHSMSYARELERALLQAFPRKEEWVQLVRLSADQSLDLLSTGPNLRAIAAAVVGNAVTHGWVDRLISEARHLNPGNRSLMLVAASLLGSTGHAIRLEGLHDGDRPQLAVRDSVDTGQLTLVANPPASSLRARTATDAFGDVGPYETHAGEPPKGESSRLPSREQRGASATGSSLRPPSAERPVTSATSFTLDAAVRRDRKDMEPLVMKNPDVREGTEFPAIVVFVLIKGLKDCSDAPAVPSALQALNEALRGIDSRAFVLSTIAGVIVVVPDTASWSADNTLDALNQAKVGLPLRVGVVHGTVEVVRDIDDELNLIGPPINIAARLATSSGNPGLLVHKSYADFIDGALSAAHWLHRSVRKMVSIAGKPQDPLFICFEAPHKFDAKPLERYEQYPIRPAVLVAYDLPKFSAGDRAQLRQRFTRLAHVFQKLRQSAPMQTVTALLSPGGDGGVLVLDGMNFPDAAAIASRLRSLTEIESLDHAETIAVAIRIGLHYGPVAHYLNARGIHRPTGLAVFVADEIAGDDHARSRKGIIFTHLLADSLAEGNSQRLASEFEVLPELPTGPASGVERFVQRAAASSR